MKKVLRLQLIDKKRPGSEKKLYMQNLKNKPSKDSNIKDFETCK